MARPGRRLAPIREAVIAEQRVLIFLAGPNGSGKSTFFDEYLEDLGLPYVNADVLARRLRDALPGSSADELQRRAFEEAEAIRSALLEAGISFCTETVFSDPYSAKVDFLKRARAAGYTVFVIFIGLDSPQLSIGRVKQRVAAGGHDVPDEKLISRFPRTLANLRGAVLLADEAFLFDNSSVREPYRLVVLYEEGQIVNRYPPLPSWLAGLPGL
ncbi:MAG: zeta toxin family protein [Candidatus Rokuibacteriota bacterium]